MKIILIIILCLPLALNAQTDTVNSGVHWISGLSWQQIKEKARTENKYIFLDCYTTWCGPCKRMDKEVYTNDTLGAFMNDKFISIKVQMDKSSTDNEQTKSWYNDAIAIENEYRVNSFPTFIFLSPQNTWVHKAEGYKYMKDLMKDVQVALEPGMVYKDPNEDIYQLIEQYRKGIKNYSKMAYIIKKSRKLGGIDTAIVRAMRKEYIGYLSKQTKRIIYTKENLEFLTSAPISDTSYFFKFFYTDGKAIDRVIGIKGYSTKIVDNTIRSKLVLPFYNEYAFKPQGLYMMGAEKTDTSEADWNRLYSLIRKNYSSKDAKRNTLYAKTLWYDGHYNSSSLFRSYLLYLDEYGIDDVDTTTGLFGTWLVNEHLYNLFKQSNNPKELKRAAKWMKKVVNKATANVFASHADTYANLLYKLGRKKDAIFWEHKALNSAVDAFNNGHIGYDWLVKSCSEMLNKMKKNKPTWDVPN